MVEQVGAELSLKDLELIDKHCVNQLEELRGMTEGTEEEKVMFEALDYTWSTSAADGKTIIDLRPNGRDQSVLFEERFEYARKVEMVRLHEFRCVAFPAFTTLHQSATDLGPVISLAGNKSRT